MKKEVKQHLVYALIIIIIVAGITYYGQVQTEETRKMLAQEISQLTVKIGDLESRSALTQKSIINLRNDLQQKETAIQSLSGDLEKVKVENKNN